MLSQERYYAIYWNFLFSSQKPQRVQTSRSFDVQWQWCRLWPIRLGWAEKSRDITENGVSFHLSPTFFFPWHWHFWSDRTRLSWIKRKNIHLKAVFFTRVFFRQIGFLTWLSKWLHQWQCWHKGSYRNPQKRKDLTEPSGSSLHLCQLNVIITGLWFDKRTHFYES